MVEQPDPIFDATAIGNDPSQPSRSSIKDTNFDSEMAMIALESGWGGSTSRYGAALYGINMLGTPFPLLPNTDNYGLIFFTRPDLNLSYDNLMAERRFAQMMNTNDTSIYRAIRAYLDPTGQRRLKDAGSPLVDPENPFICLLSNLCDTCTGWPDPSIDTYKSRAGNYKEQWTMYDGTFKLNGTFNLSVTVRNAMNDPISYMINSWTRYGSLVYDGTFVPRIEAMIYRYIDYQTRIYRIVLDATKTKVQKFACTSTAIPIFNNEGSHFDYDASKPFNANLDQLTINFECTGAQYNDPIIIDEFNRLVMIYKPAMRPEVRSNQMRKVDPVYWRHMNFHCYPFIDIKTMEMQWWVDREVYDTIIGV